MTARQAACAPSERSASVEPIVGRSATTKCSGCKRVSSSNREGRHVGLKALQCCSPTPSAVRALAVTE